jgi:putative SOS response-associated peptidase YedK
MCNEYAREIELARAKLRAAFAAKSLPPFEWRDGRVPNDLDGTASVKIRDTAPVVRVEDGILVGAMTTWAWPGPHGKPVFNFVSEGRDFSKNDRVLILATGFYEYTAPEKPKIKLKDQHFFTMHGEPWFWIGGIVKNDCFTMLTTTPGPDVAPYHDRQIVTFAPSEGLHWLDLSKPQAELLHAPPAKTFDVATLRKDGVAVLAHA